MTKCTHQDFVERLKQMETRDLLYLLVEAKAGRYVDILCKVPAFLVLKAEASIELLIGYTK